MVLGDDFDASQILDLYLHDYLVKKKMDKVAAIFRKEAQIEDIVDNPVAIDSPNGFLHEWWTIFYDIYTSRQLQHEGVEGRASIRAKPMTKNEQQSIRPIVPHLDSTQNGPGNYQIATDFDEMLGEPPPSLSSARMLEGIQHFTQPARNYGLNLPILEASTLNPSASVATNSSYSQQQSYNQAQQLIVRDSGNPISIGRAEPLNDTLYGGQNDIFPLTRSHDAGVNGGVDPASLDILLDSLIQASSYPQQFPMLTEEDQQNPLLSPARSINSGNQASACPIPSDEHRSINSGNQASACPRPSDEHQSINSGNQASACPRTSANVRCKNLSMPKRNS